MRQEIDARSKTAAAPVLEALHRARIPVASIGELNSVGSQYPAAVPILCEWLHRTDYVTLKWGIARVLSAPWMRPIPRRDIILAFEEAVAEKGYEHNAKWQLGDLIRQIAHKSVLDDMICVISDKRHGRAREMIAMGLGKIKDERAVDALLALLRESDLVGHAIEGLGALKSPRAVPAIEPFSSIRQDGCGVQPKTRSLKLDALLWSAKNPRMPQRQKILLVARSRAFAGTLPACS